MMTKVPVDADVDELAFAADLRDAFGPHAADRFRACPPPDVLHAADADALPRSVAADVRTHVEHCSLCRMLVRDLKELPVASLTDVERRRIYNRIVASSARSPRAAWKPMWWTGVAAALATAAAVAFALLPAGDVSVPSAPPPPALQRAAASAPSVIEVDKPDVRLSVAAVLLLRGDASRADDLVKGLAAYRHDDFRAAADYLARVAPTTAVPDLPVYLGVSYLHAGDPAAAARTLAEARARQHGAVDDLDWYLAVAHVRLGQAALARDEFDRMCNGTGARAAQACAASGELVRQ